MSQSNSERVAYGFIQQTLGLTGGNLTIHLRKLEDAGYIVTTKEFVDAKPRTWVETTREGLRAFSDYLANLQRTLNMSSVTTKTFEPKPASVPRFLQTDSALVTPPTDR